jgi:hypothetical protein
MQARCLVALGATHMSTGTKDLFNTYHQRALKIAKEAGDIDLQYLINLNLGKANYLSDLKNSYNYLKESIQLNEKIGNRIIEEESHIHSMITVQTVIN